MNKQDFSDWKNHPITKQIFQNIIEVTQEVHERTKIRDTIDQTAMQVCRDEGFCEGVSAFTTAIDDMGLEVRDDIS